MTDQENFLERWSRRKREATDAGNAPQTPKPSDEAAPTAPAETTSPRGVSDAATPHVASGPEFDPASLPPIESIQAATDIRPFLAPGVPAALTRAALRRAWLADPAIRDFVGLQENDWNFNDPTGVPGFGELPADFDARKLVAEMFGDPEPATDEVAASGRTAATRSASQSAQFAGKSDTVAIATASSTTPERPSDEQASAAAAADTSPITMQHDDEFVQHNKNIATQYNQANSARSTPESPRKHGSALPD